MAYMDLIRGLGDGERIEYPIFEMEILDVFTVGLVSAGGSTWRPFLSVAYTNNADISAAFPDGIPPTVETDGVVCQNDYKYVAGSPAWTLKTQAFSGIAPTATPPEDWKTNFFDYYTASTRKVSGITFAIFKSVASDALTYHNSPPTWNPNTSYYHDDLPLQQRAAHIFTTDAGWSFGVNISPNWGYGYIRAVANCNPEHAIVGLDDVFCIHDSKGNQYGGYIQSDTLAPYQLQSGFTNSIPFLQIFVHCVYNDADYYGIAQILMSGTSATAHPIGIRMLAFPAECYGDSIKTGDTPQGGIWGNDTERGGGDGTFSAPSNNDGDRSGSSLLSAISTANVTFKTVLGSNYNLYYVPPADLTKILAVLYSSDYFQRFENSMYNPLSAVLNCALIPEIFCKYSASVSDMTAGGYNISQHIFPNPIQFASPEPLIMQHIGDIDITKYFGAFPDFAPYTQCKLHLPYIGEIAIDMNKIAHGTLSVDYVCDVMSGNVTAWIWCNDKDGNHTYCYNATGNCAYSIPLFANSSDGSAIGKIIGGITSIAAGNVFSGVASTASGAASSISRHTQISGTFSGNVGITTNPKCFAEFSRPQWANPANYQNQSGIPSEISGKLSDFRGGFVRVETIDLQNVPATEAELAEIESLLESGIYYVSN